MKINYGIQNTTVIHTTVQQHFKLTGYVFRFIKCGPFSEKLTAPEIEAHAH
jgi:hypothetical protein